MTGTPTKNDVNETRDCNQTTKRLPNHDDNRAVKLFGESVLLNTSLTPHATYDRLQEINIYSDKITVCCSRSYIHQVGVDDHISQLEKCTDTYSDAFYENVQCRHSCPVMFERVSDGQNSSTGSVVINKQNQDIGAVKESHLDVIMIIGRSGIGKSAVVNSKFAGDIQESSYDNIQQIATMKIDETQLHALLDTLRAGMKRESMQTFWTSLNDLNGTGTEFSLRQSLSTGKLFVKDGCDIQMSPVPPPTSVPEIAVFETFKKTLLKTDNLQRNAAHQAAISGDFKRLQWLLGTFGLPAEAKSSNKLTMLHLATMRQHLQIVEYLCKTHVVLLPETDAVGRNACHIAAQKGNLAIVKILVAHGTDVYSIADDGSTLLHIAASHENSDMVSYLCENFFFNHLNISNNLGMKPIHFAARCSLPNVKILLDKGEEPHVQSKTGSTIAHVAALQGMLDILKFVSENYGYVLMVTDCVGFNAAHHASRHGHLECLKYLLGKTFQLASMVNCHGWTIAHLAAREGQLKVLAYLYENYPQIAAQVDADDWNVAHHASQHGHVNCLEYLFQNKIVDPCAADKRGMTFLDIAVRHGRENIVQWLRSSSVTAIVDMNDGQDHLPIGRARQNGELKQFCFYTH